MVLIVLAGLLVAGIAYFQVIQGIYSSIIMAICTTAALALAINYYEPAATMVYDTGQTGNAQGVMLIALFGVALVLLRVIADWTLTGNVYFDVWPNRIVSGAIGLYVGIVCVGVLLVGMQMMNFRDAFFTYRPYKETLRRDQRMAPFFPDEAVVALADHLSAGPFRGSDRAYSDNHPSLLLELYAKRNRCPQEREVNEEELYEEIGRVDCRPDAMELLGWFDVPADPNEWPSDPLIGEVAPGDPAPRPLAMRVVVKQTAVDLDEDDEGSYRLPATHFRLVTLDAETGEYHDRYPIGYLTGSTVTSNRRGGTDPNAEAPWQFHPAPQSGEWAKVGELFVARPWRVNKGPAELVVDWVYLLPEGELPQYVTFRRVARAAATATDAAGNLNVRTYTAEQKADALTRRTRR